MALAGLLNFGSLSIDHVYSVPELARDGMTVASTGYAWYAGGKGLNQSVAAARAGARVQHCGAVGDDGGVLIESLAVAGVDTRYVAGRHTASGQAFIQVDAAGRNAIVVVPGANHQLERVQVDTALNAAGPGDWVLLQNETNLTDYIIDRAHARGLAVAWNFAPASGEWQRASLERLAMLIVNEDEAITLTGKGNASQSIHWLATHYPGLSAVVTLGGKGLLAYDAAQGQMFRAGAYAMDVVDETGAGDAFVGYLLAELVRSSQNLTGALTRASAAGALAVTRAGASAAIPQAGEVAALAEQPLPIDPMAPAGGRVRENSDP